MPQCKVSTHGDIESFLGHCLETICRTLTELRQQCLLQDDRRHILILDLACFHDFREPATSSTIAIVSSFWVLLCFLIQQGDQLAARNQRSRCANAPTPGPFWHTFMWIVLVALTYRSVQET